MAEAMIFSKLFSRPGDTPIAVNKGQLTTLDELAECVQRWVFVLAQKPGQRWAVYHTDAVEFFAILLALWQLQRTACVPGDNLPGTVERLSSRVDGFAGDFPIPTVVELERSADFSEAVGGLIFPAAHIALEIYTSGSTGEPKPILKTIGQLECESTVLEKQWPSQPGEVVLATVSHQHLYGMTFRLFWPALSNRMFERNLCEYTEDIFHQAQCYESFSVVSSPSHLGRMNTSVDWKTVADRCTAVFSSAAPLLRMDSLASGQLLAAPIREIYGSSETGAVAWRCQQDTQTDALWAPLPDIELLEDLEEKTSLRSPYLGDTESLLLADRIKLYDEGLFSLEGRLDSVVKVEGKRLSLLELENQLQNNSWVQHVKALTITRKRVEIGVVIELSKQGAQQLEQFGRQAVIKILKTEMSVHFEAVLLPRRWRFVEQMPYNSQGKLPLQTLQALFEKEALEWPRIINEEVTADQAMIVCQIPSNLVYFDGHFENNPILPGIVQVHWAEAFGRRLFVVDGQFLRLEVVKFQQVIVPNTTIKLALKHDKDKQKLTFQYSSQRGVHSSGRICFG